MFSLHKHIAVLDYFLNHVVLFASYPPGVAKIEFGTIHVATWELGKCHLP